MSSHISVSEVEERIKQLKATAEQLGQELQNLDAARQQTFLRAQIVQGVVAVLEDLVRTTRPDDGV